MRRSPWTLRQITNKVTHYSFTTAFTILAVDNKHLFVISELTSLRCGNSLHLCSTKKLDTGYRVGHMQDKAVVWDSMTPGMRNHLLSFVGKEFKQHCSVQDIQVTLTFCDSAAITISAVKSKHLDNK